MKADSLCLYPMPGNFERQEQHTLEDTLTSQIPDRGHQELLALGHADLATPDLALSHPYAIPSNTTPVVVLFDRLSMAKRSHQILCEAVCRMLIGHTCSGS